MVLADPGPSPAAVGAPVPVVGLTGLWRTYGADPPVHALSDVDLRIDAGDWVAIVGPSKDAAAIEGWIAA